MRSELSVILRAAVGGAWAVVMAAVLGMSAAPCAAAEGEPELAAASGEADSTEVAAEVTEPATTESAESTIAAEAAAVPEAKAPEMANVDEIDWYTDYYEAYRAAAAEEKFLLINVLPSNASGQQQQAEQTIATNRRLQQQLANLVRLRVASDATIDVEGQPRRLLSFGTFAHLSGGAGWVLIDLRNKTEEYYGHAVSVLPYASGKYYHWQPSYLSTVLSIPAGTLTQRTMIWAVRIHPEAPQSTYGMHHPSLADGAMQQASYQANVGQQGHQNFESRFHSLSASAGSSVSEVCAESWPGQNMIDSCLDCVDSWRHSSGHWRGVSGRHRAFGYDIRQGRNGIWYGTGIFAD